MKAKEFVGKVHIAYKGKGAQKAPAVGSVKWDLYLSIANDKLRGWAEDPGYGWDLLWDEFITSYNGTSIDTPDSFIRLADEVEMNQETRKLIFKPTKKELRKSVKGAVYIAGSPKSLRFTSPIDPFFIGAEVSVPYYAYPPTIDKENTEIICENVQWLVLATAAELARNDPAKDDQFPTLNGLANVEYRKMADGAKAIVHGENNSMPRRNTFRIGG